MKAAQSPASEHGFALVVVLWTVGLLALLGVALSGSGRSQVALAQNIRGVAVAEAAADGAIQRAILQLHAGSWTADEVPRRVAIGRAVVDVTIEDEGRRLNPNFSPPPLLAALLGMAGVSPDRALALSHRIVDWRTATVYGFGGVLKIEQYRQAGLPYGPPNRPFLSTDELGLVPGMTAEIMGRLLPYLSIYQTGDPRPALGASAGGAAVQIAEMINHAKVQVGFASQDRIVRIRASAAVPGGWRFARMAVVKLRAQAGPDRPAWQIMAWE